MVACCLLIDLFCVVRYLLFVRCSSLCFVCRLLLVVGCVLFLVGSCLLIVACCFLLLVIGRWSLALGR